MKDRTLSNQIELWGFDQEVMVFRDFSLGKAFRLQGVDISCATHEDINTIKNQLRSFLNGLPPGMCLQFIQEVVSGNDLVIKKHADTLKSDALPIVEKITQERTGGLLNLDNEGRLPKHNLYLILRSPFSQRPKPRGFLNRKSPVLTETLLATEIERFKRDCDHAKASLQLSGLKAFELSDADTFGLIYNQWNPGRNLPPAMSGSLDIRDQIGFTDMVLGIDGFSLGKVFHRVISLKNLSEASFASMMETLRSLPFDSRLFVSLESLDQTKETSQLQTQRRIAYASSVGKKGVSDLDSEAKLQDIESLLTEMIQGGEKVFNFSLNVVLRSTSSEDLDFQVALTLSKLRDLAGCEGLEETYGAFDVFMKLALPNGKSPERAKKAHTSVVADFLPIYSAWPGHENPRLLLCNREGGLLGFDPFSPTLSNFNQLVSGGSGSGKSFATNLLISQMLKERPKVFILDIGASYKRLCESLGGQYIDLGIKSGESINPLSFNDVKVDEHAFDQKLKFIVSLVEIMTRENDLSPLSKYEKAQVEVAIKKVYEQTGSKEPHLSDLTQKLVSHPETEIARLGKILSTWCGDSPFGKFVDRDTTIKLSKDIVCFDLKNLDSVPELQAVCLFIITDFIWQEVQRDRTQMKIVVLDECWRLLQSDSASQFIGDIFRTFRKYRASAIAISQTVDDFSKSKVAQAVIPNSSIKWILRQKGDQEELKNVLQLNVREMDLVSSLTSIKGQYSESFLMMEDKRQVVRIQATPLEYWLATTDPSDLIEIERAKRARPEASDQEVLENLASLYPKGSSQPTVSR